MASHFAAPDREGAGRAWLRMLAVALLVVACDQASKRVADASIESGERIDLVLGFELVDVSNRGIAFGLFDDGGALVPAVTLAMLVVLVAWFALDWSRRWLWLGIGLLLGGALGNLVDRLRETGVTDFFDPPLWPAFNLADVAITAGVAVVALIAFAADGGETEP